MYLNAFSAQKCRGRFGLRRESRLRTAFGFSDSGRIEYYRGDRKAVSNATSRLRLAPLTDTGSIFLPEERIFAVLEEDQPEELSRDERRQFDRSRLIVDVYFDGADLTGVASTKDISLGGLYLSTQVEIPKGSTLTLRIPLGRQHIVLRGDVVYSLPGHGVGVRFHRLSDEKRALMERELSAQ